MAGIGTRWAIFFIQILIFYNPYWGHLFDALEALEALTCIGCLCSSHVLYFHVKFRNLCTL